MSGIQGIFFDFDGVLADTEPMHWRCWAEVLAPDGVTLTWGFYQQYCVGIDDREMLRLAGAHMQPPRDGDAMWRRYPAKRELFRARMLAAPPIDPALDEVLGTLHRRYRLAVVSSSACAEIEPLLEAAGIRRHFDTVVGAGDVEHRKPAPDPYMLAAKRLGVTSALVVEDSEAGIASGRAAGFEVLAIDHVSNLIPLLERRLGGMPRAARVPVGKGPLSPDVKHQ